jgi:hypothetical protein
VLWRGWFEEAGHVLVGVGASELDSGRLPFKCRTHLILFITGLSGSPDPILPA